MKKTTRVKGRRRGARNISMSSDVIPYHGAEPLLETVRQIIASIPEGSGVPMSARKMIEFLEEEKKSGAPSSVKSKSKFFEVT